MDNQNNPSLDTLISVSGTIAGIALALVGILSGKSALTQVDTITDDVFLFASIGHLWVVVLGYIAQRNHLKKLDNKLIFIVEKIFYASLLLTVSGAILMVYTKL